MKRKALMMALWFGTVAITVFADYVTLMDPWEIDRRTLDDYHRFLYNGGHYISLNCLMAVIGVLCIAFLVWRLKKKDQCGTWSATLSALLLRLLRELYLGFLGVLLLTVIFVACILNYGFLVVVVGVLYVAFLVWRLRKEDQCGTWFAAPRPLSLKLLRVLLYGLLGVLLLVAIAICSTFGKKPLFYLDVPWNYAQWRESRRESGWFGPVKEAQATQTEKRHIKSVKKFKEH